MYKDRVVPTVTMIPVQRMAIDASETAFARIRYNMPEIIKKFSGL